VAGVLLEMRAVPAAPNVGILGIGVNVGHTADDFPQEIRETATSLSLASGKPVDRHAIAISILHDLDRTYASALSVTEL
jgi:BirA family biotin operon repressor/biotin-[acetyl-CoA-carboxylase] ligase